MTFNFSGSLSSAYLVFSVLCILSFPHLLPSTHKRIHVVFSFTHPIHCFLRSLPSSPFSSFLSLNWNHPQTTTNLYLFFFISSIWPSQNPNVSLLQFVRQQDWIIAFLGWKLTWSHPWPEHGFFGLRWNGSRWSWVEVKWVFWVEAKIVLWFSFEFSLCFCLFLVDFFLVDFSLIFFWFLG